MKKEEIEKLREVMGTLPDKNPKLKTEFHIGVEGIKVELIDHNVNPYKSMYVLGTTCWGKQVNKWEQTSPEGRFLVIKSILEGQTLPLALEAPVFVFAIEGLSRSAFDQIARARVGVVFSARGMRDNNWKDVGIRIPSGIAKDLELLEEFKQVSLRIKEFYAKMVGETGHRTNWQAARAILPMSICYGFSMAINYAALRNMCAKRLCFSEQADTVATVWLMRKAVEDKFPFMANYLRPACDWANKCLYYRTYGLSKLFGCLFKSCGRHKVEGLSPEEEIYCEFNESSCDIITMEQELGIKIPRPNEYKTYETIDDLDPKDRRLIEE